MTELNTNEIALNEMVAPQAIADAPDNAVVPFRSLRIRLLQPLLFLSLVAAIAGSLGIYLITSSQLKQELQLRGRLISSAIAIAAETSSSLIDLQRSILAMAGEPNIDNIALVDIHFQPVFNNEMFNADTHPDERDELNGIAQQALRLNTSVGTVDRHNSNIYQVITPIHISALPHNNLLKPEPALLIVNLLTAESRQKALNTTLLLTLLFSSLGIAALIMIYYLMNHWVLKPSLTIVKVLQRQSIKQAAVTGFKPIHELGLIGQTIDQLSQILATREQALEQALIAAQGASVSKSQFLANMSHELRTPMNAILGLLALLRKTELNSRQADYAVKSEGAARSLLSLLNDILDISKAEAGKMELDPVPFSLDILKRDISVILATNLTHKSVELVFNIDSDVPRYFRGDAMRLQQILINLGGNAIKFTERGFVTITITLQSNNANLNADKRSLQISVQDSGIGIAPENQAKIFSGFTQAEASTTRRFGGTGLGLAISQRLVELMGGKLQLESSLGKGSRFFFTIDLPVLDDEAIASFNATFENTSYQNSQSRLQKMHVLLVEDNLNNQQIAMELLEAEGAIITIASHGQEALDILSANLNKTQQAGFDVVLMDLQMPVMDGITAARAIRNQLKLNDLPIIAMTANAMASDRENCLAAGMNDHVGKPFDLQHLVAILCKQAGKENSVKNQTDDYVALIDAPPASATSNTQENYELDVKAAVVRMGGNQGLYFKMLPKFVATLTNLPDQLHSHVLQGEFFEASRALHSLKGLSATMGATHLAEEASRGEKILANSPDINSATLVVEQLCIAILQTIPIANELISHQ